MLGVEDMGHSDFFLFLLKRVSVWKWEIQIILVVNIRRGEGSSIYRSSVDHIFLLLTSNIQGSIYRISVDPIFLLLISNTFITDIKYSRFYI